MKTQKQINERLRILESNNDLVKNEQGHELNQSSIDELKFISNMFNIKEYKNLSNKDRLFKIESFLRIRKDKYKNSPRNKHILRKWDIVEWCLKNDFKSVIL